jgi:hypothetical protein
VTMTRDPSQIVELEGRQVNVALDDGSRIDDCQLVSYGRHNVSTVWLVADGGDLTIPLDRIVEIWEA